MWLEGTLHPVLFSTFHGFPLPARFHPPFFSPSLTTDHINKRAAPTSSRPNFNRLSTAERFLHLVQLPRPQLPRLKWPRGGCIASSKTWSRNSLRHGSPQLLISPLSDSFQGCFATGYGYRVVILRVFAPSTSSDELIWGAVGGSLACFWSLLFGAVRRAMVVSRLTSS